MKWNDAWLSNMDRNDDNKLDRHYGYTTYIGSGAWETNHMWGENDDGTQWNYYYKIVAAPVDATKSLGVWYTSDGTEIGPDIWGEFAVIFEVSNDPLLATTESSTTHQPQQDSATTNHKFFFKQKNPHK